MSIKFKIIVISLFLFFQTFWAQNDFEKGNILYKKGNYTEAISAYESILKTGQESPELYFNLGNSYYKKDQIAPSIYYFEKALLLDPSNKEVQNNLTFAQEKGNIKINETTNFGFYNAIKSIINKFHFNTWAIIAIVFGFLFLGSFLGYYFSIVTFNKRIYFASMIFVFLLLLLSLVTGFIQKSNCENQNFAIIFSKVVSVKSEPKATSSEIIILPEGTKVTILDDMGNYYEIQLDNSKSGWLEKNTVKKL